MGHFLTTTVVAFAVLLNRRNGALSPAGKRSSIVMVGWRVAYL